MKKNFRKKQPREEKEFDQKLIDLSRVTRVTKGGKQLSFRATVVIGDRKGRVGFGIGKATDVSAAISKAAKAAKKKLIAVPVVNGTVPYEVRVKFGAGKVMIKPAKSGTGIKAGGATRVALELAGVPNATGKIMGSNNKINILYATMEALRRLRAVEKPKRREESKK